MHGSVVRLRIHGTKNFMRIKHEGKYRNRVVTDTAFEEHLSEDIIVTINTINNIMANPSFSNAIPYKNNRLPIGLLGSNYIPFGEPSST